MFRLNIGITCNKYSSCCIINICVEFLVFWDCTCLQRPITFLYCMLGKKECALNHHVSWFYYTFGGSLAHLFLYYKFVSLSFKSFRHNYFHRATTDVWYISSPSVSSRVTHRIRICFSKPIYCITRCRLQVSRLTTWSRI